MNKSSPATVGIRRHPYSGDVETLLSAGIEVVRSGGFSGTARDVVEQRVQKQHILPPTVEKKNDDDNTPPTDYEYVCWLVVTTATTSGSPRRCIY